MQFLGVSLGSVRGSWEVLGDLLGVPGCQLGILGVLRVPPLVVPGVPRGGLGTSQGPLVDGWGGTENIVGFCRVSWEGPWIDFGSLGWSFGPTQGVNTCICCVFANVFCEAIFFSMLFMICICDLVFNGWETAVICTSHVWVFKCGYIVGFASYS